LSQQSIQEALAEVIQEHGKIDNLITSAGFTENFEAINYPIERVRKLWSVNVNGTYLFAIGVAKYLMAACQELLSMYPSRKLPITPRRRL